MNIQELESIGCIDYGNNNFFEVMKDKDNKLYVASHDDDPESPESYQDVWEFLSEFRSDWRITYLSDVLQQLSELTEVFNVGKQP